jgi:hypothetical protein
LIVADIAAGSGAVTAISLIITAFTVLIPLLRQTKKVHEIVNQQRTDLVNYQRALIHALQTAGIDVPLDQSIMQPPVTSEETP